MTKHLVALAAAAVVGPSVVSAAPFSDNFDTNTAANYTVNQNADTTVQFAYDYSADGIPAAPGSSTTLGVKFTANGGDATAAAAAVNISPTGYSVTGDYTLRFHSWLNVNGPFPAGGAGSTQFVTAGVGNGGTTVQSSVTGTGPWFAGSNEGGATGDYRAYTGTSLQADSSTVYANPDTTAGVRRESSNTYYHTAIPGAKQAPLSQQTAHSQQTGTTAAGSLGFAWHLHEIAKVGNAVTWSINGLEIATFDAPTLSGDNVFVGHWDPFNSITDNPAVNFGIIDNLEVVPVPEPTSLALIGFGGLALLARRRRV